LHDVVAVLFVHDVVAVVTYSLLILAVSCLLNSVSCILSSSFHSSCKGEGITQLLVDFQQVTPHSGVKPPSTSLSASEQDLAYPSSRKPIPFF